MRRAVIATVGTAAGLFLLLSYKAGSTVHPLKVTGASGTGATTTTVPAGHTSTTVASSGTYTGQLVDYAYGDIEVSVNINGRRVISVNVPQNDASDPRSQMINSQAVPILEQEAVTAQGLNFDAVSGATFTSDAFAQSLQTALQRAGQ